MGDLWHKLLKWLDHNRYLVLGLVLTTATVGWLAGCESTTGSLVGDGKVDRVTFQQQAAKLGQKLEAQRLALISEIEAHNQSVELGHADLDAQDAVKQQIVSTLAGVVTSAAGGGFNPAQLVTSGVSIAALLVGGGAVVDNRRKDKIIAGSKNGTNA